MKYALIGCGRIAKNHVAAAISNSQEIEIAALCDTMPEHAQRYIDEYGLKCPIYTDYRKLLEEIRPDFVAIATESGKHAAIALDCIQAGVNVLIEKPIALSVADAQAILDAAKAAGVTVGVCHQNRFNRAVQKLRSAIEEGRFGRIYNIAAVVRWNRDEGYYKQAPWRGTWAQDGGCLMNQCIHGIDLLRWMMGDEVDTVYGVIRQQQHPYLEAEDIGMAVVTFKNGTVATIEGTTNAYPQNLEETLYLFGETGTVKIGGKSANNLDVWNFADETEADAANRGLEEPASNVYGNGHTSLYADVIEAIEKHRKPYVDAVAGRNALEIVLAIYKSTKTGQPVKLPLKEFASVDMRE